MQEGDKQLTRCQLLGRGINSPSTPRSNVQLCWPRNPNTFSSDVYPSQVPQHNLEGTHLILASRRTKPNIRQQ
jgi:hypothetical protein